MKPSLRFEILKRDRFACVYCGGVPPTVLLEVDHIVPRADGGKDEEANLVTSCTSCNRGKGARRLEEGLSATVSEKSVADLALRIAQAREFYELQGELEALIGEQLSDVWELWATQFGGTVEDGVCRVEYGFPSEAKVREGIEKLGLPRVLEAVRVTAVKFNGRARWKSPFAYFGGVIRNMVKERDGDGR